jgi:uncharacterized protein with HEPN domain
MKDSRAHIDLAISACKKVSEYLEGITESAFATDSKTQSAVIMQLQIIGELAKNIDDGTKANIEAPWKMIIGLRNMISHAYFMLELETIWKIASEDVPMLEKTLLKYLEKEGTEYIPPLSDTTPLLD